MMNHATVSGLESFHLLYIDPGSGTFLVQLLVASLLGAGVAASSVWKKTFGRIIGLLRHQENQNQQPDDKRP